MALFDESVQVVPAPRRRMPRGTVLGIWALVVALAALLLMTFLPTSFVIQRPGPVYNTLGEARAADGTMVPLISVEGARTYPTDGSLDLLTVETVGNRERTPSWLELATAWFDPSRAVLPIDAVFPDGQTSEQRSEQSAFMMIDSQKEATAAALLELGYDVDAHLRVYGVIEDSASVGILEAGDVIVEADGTTITDVEQLRDVIKALAGAPVPLTIERDGVRESVTVTPQEASAGMMFALGIIDTLTPGELNGGRDVAGTGTIVADGTVGAIGGIRQKLFGARDAGAAFFLAPRANCNEVTGHIPDGLRVFAVDDLDDALAALAAIATDGDIDGLPTCDLTAAQG